MIDGILALGHFCESHGPCVILCTQRYDAAPEQAPHNLTVPWCEACQSIDLKQLLICQSGTSYYVTTRTPIQQDLSFLLKQAVVRSLSCEEETSKDGSTMYFGDNERGHILSHTFSLQDSLARGFYRKYCIIVLMKDKVYLLNAWHILTKHIKEVVEDLQSHARMVNGSEQEIQSQRAFRQAQVATSTSIRSLSQLTGQPAIFAHIHLWFCWILNLKVATEKLQFTPELEVYNTKSCPMLRAILQEMGEDIFNKLVYCYLTGIPIDTETSILDLLTVFLPNKWPALINHKKCKVVKENNSWISMLDEALPSKFPTLQNQSVKALRDYRLPDDALDLHIQALVFQWHNIVKTLCYCTTYNKNLLQSMGIQNCDLPLLSFWIYHCSESSPESQNIMDNLRKVLK